MWIKGNPLILLMKMLIGTATKKNRMEICWEIKIRTTIWSSNPPSGYISRCNKIIFSVVYLYSMFIAALFTITKLRKQPKFLSTDEWIKKINTQTHKYMYIMNISQLKKKKKILLFSTICMTLEGIIQSEVKKRKTLAKWYHLSVESSYLWSS